MMLRADHSVLLEDANAARELCLVFIGSNCKNQKKKRGGYRIRDGYFERCINPT